MYKYEIHDTKYLTMKKKNTKNTLVWSFLPLRVGVNRATLISEQKIVIR